MNHFTLVVILTLLVIGFPRSTEAAEASEALARQDFVRKNQSIGDALFSADGSLLIYEWQRPYDWKRKSEGSLPQLVDYPLTWLYQVWVAGGADLNSKYALLPEPGASYRLGSVSADNKWLTFYRIGEDNVVRVGAVRLADCYQIIFQFSPSGDHFDQRPLWIDGERFIYWAAIKGDKDRLLIADVTTADAQQYSGVIPEFPVSTRKATERSANGRLLAVSGDGKVRAYEQSSAEELKLILLYKTGIPEVIFENAR